MNPNLRIGDPNMILKYTGRTTTLKLQHRREYNWTLPCWSERELTEPNPSRWSLKSNKLGRREQLSVYAAEIIGFEHGLDRRFLAEMSGSSCPEPWRLTNLARKKNKKGRCGSHSLSRSRHSRSSENSSSKTKKITQVEEA
ncbi:hypothetical protein BRARA_C02634 [Brassica rapa]|uniref:Uncharacterized protein n=1 Tax=Brassica campestris TaxID=3711 RepID=A0A398A637_BRACM|nr:hypothetical protein BRARA_C02634 [Brassica rapa]